MTRPKLVKELMRKVAHQPGLIAVRSRVQVCRFGSMGTETCFPQGPEGVGAPVDLTISTEFVKFGRSITKHVHNFALGSKTDTKEPPITFLMGT